MLVYVETVMENTVLSQNPSATGSAVETVLKHVVVHI